MTVLGLAGALPALGVELAHESDLLGGGVEFEGLELDVQAVLETLLIQVHLQLYIRPIIQNTPTQTTCLHSQKNQVVRRSMALRVCERI